MTDIEKKREDMIAGILPSIRTCVKDPTGYTPEDCAGDIMAVLDFKGAVMKVERGHDSDCAVLSMPSYPNGPCDCVKLPEGCVAVAPLIEEEHND